MAKSGNFLFLLLELILPNQMADLLSRRDIYRKREAILYFYCYMSYWQIKLADVPPPLRGILVVKNGNFRFLL